MTSPTELPSQQAPLAHLSPSMISGVPVWIPSPLGQHHSCLNSCPSLLTHSSRESHSQMQMGPHPSSAKNFPRAPQRSPISLVEHSSSYKVSPVSAPNSSLSPPNTWAKLHRGPYLKRLCLGPPALNPLPGQGPWLSGPSSEVSSSSLSGVEEHPPLISAPKAFHLLYLPQSCISVFGFCNLIPLVHQQPLLEHAPWARHQLSGCLPLGQRLSNWRGFCISLAAGPAPRV